MNNMEFTTSPDIARIHIVKREIIYFDVYNQLKLGDEAPLD